MHPPKPTVAVNKLLIEVQGLELRAANAIMLSPTRRILARGPATCYVEERTPADGPIAKAKRKGASSESQHAGLSRTTIGTTGMHASAPGSRHTVSPQLTSPRTGYYKIVPLKSSNTPYNQRYEDTIWLQRNIPKSLVYLTRSADYTSGTGTP